MNAPLTSEPVLKAVAIGVKKENIVDPGTLLATKISPGKEFRIRSLQEKKEGQPEDLYMYIDDSNNLMLTEKSHSFS